MNCWSCDKPSVGICRFCGRGVCKEHAKERPYIVCVYDEETDVPKAIVVDASLYCGICRPLPKPMEIPEIE